MPAPRPPKIRAYVPCRQASAWREISAFVFGLRAVLWAK